MEELINKEGASQTQPLTESSSKMSRIFIILGIILLVGMFSFGGYFIGRWQGPVAHVQLAQQRTTSSCVIPSAKPKTAIKTYQIKGSKNAMKSYSGSEFSVEYPSNWYVNKTLSDGTMGEGVSFSDIQSTQPFSVYSDHYKMSITFYNEQMSTTFPYSTGQQDNPTIHSVMINGYNGIQGQSVSEVGLVDEIDLKDPKGG